MPNWSIGRTGQVYVKAESQYGVAPSLASTNALRHLNVDLKNDAFSWAKSPERHTHPSQLFLYKRRTKASYTLKGQMYPSGTLNTLPEMDVLLANALGLAAVNTTLSTTIASGSSTTGATVASAAGLAKGQAIQINIASGGDAGTYVRWLTDVTGSALTWAPALPSAGAVGDTVKGGVTYGPGGNVTLPASLDIVHYPLSPAAWYNREQLGCVPDKLVLSFDSNIEPMFEISGPAKGFAASAQSQPGAFTTVGAENGIPSGMNGYFNYNGTLYQVEKVEVTINNAMDVQNTALGTNSPIAMFRKGKREVTIKVNAKVSDDLTMWTPSLSGVQSDLHLQVGTIGGQIWGIYAPVTQIMSPPDTPDGDETNNWDFSLTAMGVVGNDEVYIAQV